MKEITEKKNVWSTNENILKGIPILLSHEYGYRVVLKNDILVLGSVLLQTSENPFVTNDYDFDNQKGFYKGNFEYISPVSNEAVSGTVESYGRAKIVRFLIDHISDNDVVLDIGAGCFNIYRELNNVLRKHIDSLFINMDISGPFNSLSGGSLTKGAQRVAEKNIPTFALECDINNEKIPLKEFSVNHIVTCMALHHIKPERREGVFGQIYRILKNSGTFVNVDFYTPDKIRNVFTQAGQRGPEECSGYGMDFTEYLNLVQSIGFSFHKNNREILDSFGSPSNRYLEMATTNQELCMPLNKAVYYTILKK